MRQSKASSVHNYCIVPLGQGSNQMCCSAAQGSPPQSHSQPFSTCQQTVFAFVLGFPLIVCPNERSVLFSPFLCIKISMEIPLSARGWFPSTALLQPFPQRRCFCSTSSHKHHGDEEFQPFPFPAINLLSSSVMDLFHYPQGKWEMCNSGELTLDNSAKFSL